MNTVYRHAISETTSPYVREVFSSVIKHSENTVPHSQPINEKYIAEMRTIVKSLVKSAELFEERWNSILRDFLVWQKAVIKDTSNLTQSLELLRRLCEAFPAEKLREKPEIIDKSLLGTKNIGDSYFKLEPEGKRRRYKIVQRSISERFGVLYVLESDDGSRFAHEYFE